MYSVDQMVQHVDHVVQQVILGNRLADRVDSELWKFLTPEELGMSGSATRVMINCLCARPGASYLEIGLAAGSTFISACHKNTEDNSSQFVGVEAWSENHFRSGVAVKNKFYENFKKYNGDIENSNSKIEIIQENAFNIDFYNLFLENNLAAINCYFYDADHSENATWWGLASVYPVLEDYFVYIVDDWNDQDVRKGAWRVIKDLGFSIHNHYQFCSLAGDSLLDKDGNSKIPGVDPEKDFGDYRSFYNGIGLFVLEKNPSSLFELLVSKKYKEFNKSLHLQDGKKFNYVEDCIVERLGVLNPPGDILDLQW